jgi:hypothetical protein
MRASARIPGRSGAICRVATPKQAKNAAPNSSGNPAPVEILHARCGSREAKIVGHVAN